MDFKKTIKLILSIALGLFLGLSFEAYSVIVKIFFPDKAESLIRIPGIILMILISIGIVICFVIFFISFFQELNFMKLYSNELAYVGISEELYEAALKRKKRFEKNKYNVGYIGSLTLISNYLCIHEKYEDAAKLLEEIDLEELKKKFKIDSANPANDKLSTYLSLLDCLICIYSQIDNKEKEEKTAGIFNPCYNAFIHKYENLSNILYEAKLRDLLYKGEFTEALSILDILKTSDESFYKIMYLDYLYYKKETDLSLIDKAINDAIEGSENSRTKAFLKQVIEEKKNNIYRGLKNEVQMG